MTSRENDSSPNVDKNWKPNQYHVCIFAPAVLAALNANSIDPKARAPGQKIIRVHNLKSRRAEYEHHNVFQRLEDQPRRYG
jgi:hypothetical protein